VAGARQVGKSTLLSHHLPDWEAIVFDPVIDVAAARSDPELFLKNHPTPLVLDEIQYCPELAPTIKRYVDRDNRPGRFVLTGSQQWSVLKSISESLAGRAVFIDLEGFSIAEIAEQLPDKSWLERYLIDPETFVSGKPERHNAGRTLNELIWRGSLPKMDTLPLAMAQDFFAAYLRTYIERDVRLLMNAADWQQFGHFVQLTAALTAQEINFSQFGRDISVTPQTSRRWLSTLSATFQWFQITAYQGNTIKRISSRPKGHFADTGLACFLAKITTPGAISGHPLAGPLFETFMAGEIRKLVSAMSRKPAIYHWKTYSGGEVDLLMEFDGRIYPIEIKLATRPTRRDTTGFDSLRATYPKLRIAPGLVISPTDSLFSLNGLDYAAPFDMI
jgi:hypothetical protein